jgi:septal ring factor EnvC (AmiA/AmiB activator)
MTLQESTQKLRQAEQSLAKVQGELQALDAQVNTFTARLAEYGLTPEQVPAALEQLSLEEQKLQGQIEQLTEELAGAIGG